MDEISYGIMDYISNGLSNTISNGFIFTTTTILSKDFTRPFPVIVYIFRKIRFSLNLPDYLSSEIKKYFPRKISILAFHVQENRITGRFREDDQKENFR